MEAKKHRDDVRLEGKPDDVTVIFCLVKADQPMAD
ncbi:hypothetical protein BU14_0104s0026 [Porphyra umbilicalis]|uniref:Uncharacterized protein n=1 Tax=Porphyra umbilicalis TaxID=2786 RepID=A0A1X6PCQ6_PORUM|nr:hypothetical protein BU14_0104s0026 [Porphyra umbilicalis]|eukprot:OSX78652.1 hypothetical protein BU14_0104s0026 [Porphyra umbilicalis]